MFPHERYARVQILQNLDEGVVIHQASSAGRIESPRDVVEVSVVVQISADVVSQLLKPLLLDYELFALRLERGGLGLDVLERVGQGGEELERGIGVFDEGVEVPLSEGQLILVDPEGVSKRCDFVEQ